MTLARTLNLYALETRFEFLKMLRLPAYSVSTIAYPLAFYVMFGLVLPTPSFNKVRMAQYLLGTYGAFAVIGATLMCLGAGIAVERGLGWLTVKRASPMPTGAYLAAKVAVALAFSLIVLLILFACGAGFGGVRLNAAQWLQGVSFLLLGSLPFALLGIALGMLVDPNSASNMVNLVHLPLSFFSGLWVPLPSLPQNLQDFATFLPYYHLGQIGLLSLGVKGQGTLGGHFAALAAFSVVFLGIIFLVQRRKSERMYG